jgi:hypothetical protein
MPITNYYSTNGELIGEKVGITAMKLLNKRHRLQCILLGGLLGLVSSWSVYSAAGGVGPTQKTGSHRGTGAEIDPKGKVKLPSTDQMRQAKKLADRGYNDWYGHRMDKVYKLLSPAGAKRNMFKGDPAKVILAMRTWRKHIGDTLVVPVKLSLTPIQSLSQHQARVLAGLLLSGPEASKVKQDARYLDRKLLLFTYSVGQTRYIQGCFRWNGKWGLLNDPLSLQVPQGVVLR